MPNPVRILKRKYDGTVTRERTGDLVDATADAWLAVHMDATRHESLLHGEPAPAPAHMLGFLSERASPVWWLFYDELGRFVRAHADAALPARVTGRTIDFIDLDLDVIVARDMSFYVRDEDEFEANRISMAYPAHVVESARAGVRLAVAAVEARAWPLDGSADLLLGRLMAAEGPL